MTNYRPWPLGNFPCPVYGMPQQSHPSVPLGGMGMGQQRMNHPLLAHMAQQRMAQQQQRSQTNFMPAPIAHNPFVVGSGQPMAQQQQHSQTSFMLAPSVHNPFVVGSGQPMAQQQQRFQTNFMLAPSAHNPFVLGSGQPVTMGVRERSGPGGTMTDVAAQDALTLQQLTSAEPHQQKQIIGGHLNPKFCNVHTQLAGKITGTAVT